MTSWVQTPALHKSEPGVVVKDCNPIAWKVEAEKSEVQGDLQLYSGLEATWDT